MRDTTILIIEDEITINRILSSYFKASGYKIITAYDGKEGLNLFRSNSIDLVCLDIMMPKVDGWSVAKSIREQSDVPIIFMSALSEEEDILKGYELNIDDYLTKPFNPKILVAKVERLLHRYSKSTLSNSNSIIKAKNISIDITSHKIFLDDKELPLSKKEFDLLLYFVKNEGRICSRDQLLDEVWGIDIYVEDRIVDTYVKRLRKHLGDNSKYIKTVFGVGYRFETLI